MKYASFILLLISTFTLFSQEENSWKDKVSINGYVKYLYTGTSFNKDWTHGELIHNRLNSRFYFNDHFTGGLELRNRVFFGSQTFNPLMTTLLDDDNGFVNTSFSEQGDLGDPIWTSSLDRWWLNYQIKTWEFRIGRQRINWGMNYLWNMNDVFNAFNFTDFDYEERPGSDAIRVTKYIKDLNQFQLAFVPTRDFDSFILGAMYRFNYKLYDFQVISGIRMEEWFVGGGWAGSIGNVGFKGEMTLFEDSLANNNMIYTGAFSLDYTFDSGLMLSGGYYYNSNFDINMNVVGLSFNSSPKNLMPVPHAFYLQGGASLFSLFRADLIALGIPTMDGVYLMPTIGYSVSNTLDVSVVDQLLIGGNGGAFQSINARLKYSF